MNIKDRLKDLRATVSLIESLENMIKRDKEEFKEFPRLLEELEHSEVLQQIAELKQEQKNTMDLINNLDNELQRKVLIERYLYKRKWDDIAEQLHYSRQSLHGIHNKAIEQLIKQN